MVLVVGFLLLNQFRADIIAARVQSLTTQADIIAAAIAASAAVDTDTITIDPDKLLQLAPGQSAGAAERRRRDRVLDQSRAGWAGAAPSGDAHSHPRAHLRPRRTASARFAVALSARRGHALGSARVGRRLSGIVERASAYVRKLFDGACDTAKPRSLACRRQYTAGSRRRARGQDRLGSSNRRRGQHHRLSRGPDPAHDGDAGRASALDPGRRHRPGDRFRSAGRSYGFSPCSQP